MEKVDIRLDKLVLRNYKGFYTGDDENGVEITFDENLTVLIGNNGSGKSAVLDAIALFLGKLRSEITNVGETASVYPFPMASNEKKNKDVNNEKEEADIDGLFSLEPILITDYIYDKKIETVRVPKRDREGNQMFDYEGNLIEIERQEVKSYEIEIEREPKIGFSIYMKKEDSPSKMAVNKWENHSIEKEERIPEDEDDRKTLAVFLQQQIHDSFIQGEFKYLDKSLPVLAYYGANAINTDTSGELEEVENSVFDTYSDALDAKKFSFKQFFAWFDYQQKREAQGIWDTEAGKDEITQSQTKFIENAIEEILNDKDVEYKNLRVDWSVYPIEMILTKENKKTKKESKLSFSQLSSGERTLIALVADLTRRLCLANPNSENPLKGNGIVLIDEIDVHLHPKWQQKVVMKLQEVFPNVQFVVTTHSPLVLNNIYSKHIRSIENGKIYGVSDTFGHDDADDMLRIMGVKSDTREKIKEIHRLLRENKIEEAKAIRTGITTEGTFAPLLEIDLFIKRKERISHETY
jgi:predicted ATP-binding protein involved in virulence